MFRPTEEEYKLIKCEEDISQAMFPVLSLKARRPCTKIMNTYQSITIGSSPMLHIRYKVEGILPGLVAVSLNIVCVAARSCYFTPLDCLHLNTSPSLRRQQYSPKPESLSIFQSQTFRLTRSMKLPSTRCHHFKSLIKHSQTIDVIFQRSIILPHSIL